MTTTATKSKMQFLGTCEDTWTENPSNRRTVTDRDIQSWLHEEPDVDCGQCGVKVKTFDTEFGVQTSLGVLHHTFLSCGHYRLDFEGGGE